MATRIKRYETEDGRYDELLARIEAEMGPEAQLETRRFRRGGFLGLFGGRWMIEVVAVLEVQHQPASAPAATPEPVAEPDGNGGTPEEPVTDGPAAPRPPAGRKRKVDLRADEPVELEEPDGKSGQAAKAGPVIPAPGVIPREVRRPAPPISRWSDKQAGAEARISADARQFSHQQQAREAGAATARADTPVPDPPVEQPVPQPVSGTVKPANATEDQAPSIPKTEDKASKEIAELKDSISELRDTIKLLADQQKEALASRPADTPPPATETVVKPAFPDLTKMTPEQVVGMLSGGTGRVADPLALDQGANLQDAQRRVYDRLLDWNIRSYDALELINTALAEAGSGPLPSEEEMLGLIFRDICRNILVSEGLQLRTSPPGKVVALVGATGVGKTTTIAKLAAQFAFQHNARVSFVSLDNYRIAAAEQLRTYADIMGLELDIVFSRDEFDQVLTQRRACDLTLVDTAGRSPANTKQIYELREIFSAHPPDEVHLVVSASTKADDLRMLLENFEPLSYDHVIVSKLDETRSLGCLYNLSKYCQLPISYFTVGQSVPEDIRTANLSFVQTWIEQGRIT